MPTIEGMRGVRINTNKKLILMLSFGIAFIFIGMCPINAVADGYFTLEFVDYYEKTKYDSHSMKNMIKGSFDDRTNSHILIVSEDTGGRMEINFRDSDGNIDLTRQCIANPNALHLSDSHDCIAKDDNSEIMALVTMDNSVTNNLCSNTWSSTGNIYVSSGIIPVHCVNTSCCIFMYNSNVYMSMATFGLFIVNSDGSVGSKIQSVTFLPTVYETYKNIVYLFSDYPTDAPIFVQTYTGGTEYTHTYETNIDNYDLSDAELLNDTFLLSFKTNPIIYSWNITEDGNIWADLTDYGFVSINQMQFIDNVLYVSGNDIYGDALFCAMIGNETIGNIIAINDEYSLLGLNSTKLINFCMQEDGTYIYGLCNEELLLSNKNNDNKISVSTMTEHSIKTTGFNYYENGTEENKTPDITPQEKLPLDERIVKLFSNPMGDIGLFIFLFIIMPVTVVTIMLIIAFNYKSKKAKKKKGRWYK